MICLKTAISLVILIIVLFTLIFFNVTKKKELYANSNTITIDKTIVINMKKDKERLDILKNNVKRQI